MPLLTVVLSQNFDNAYINLATTLIFKVARSGIPAPVSPSAPHLALQRRATQAWTKLSTPPRRALLSEIENDCKVRHRKGKIRTEQGEGEGVVIE